MRRLLVAAVVGLAATGCIAPAGRLAHSLSASSAAGSAGVRVVARIPLPGGNSRLDYASLDSHRGLLFVAHLGASEVVEINGDRLRAIYSNYLANDAHAVAVDPATGRSYFPVLGASGGHPAVLVCEIT